MNAFLLLLCQPLASESWPSTTVRLLLFLLFSSHYVWKGCVIVF